jgi:putative aldouronate transport system permease protein
MENSSVKTREDRIYQFIIVTVLSILALCALSPFLLLISSSITDESTLLSKGYSFLPQKVSFYSYVYLFTTNSAKVFRAYGMTFLVTIVGTAISLFIGPMLAWPLSRSDYKRSKILTFMVFFTMLFNGGIVPSYIMWTQIFHIKNTILALILPGLLFNGFYIILYKNYFKSTIHTSLVEAARIDGAGEFYIYFKIVLPLSLPILATIGLMVGIGYWNDWTNSLYYISNTKMYPLQPFLKSIIDNISALSSMTDSADAAALAAGMPGTSIRMALAVVGIIPIMVLYPFFQKAFIAGITLGGVKE